MQTRKDSLENGQIYHILNKSIAGYEVFNNNIDYQRIIDTVKYYQRYPVPIKYSELNRLSIEIREQVLQNVFKQQKIVEIVAYCIMPSHFHFVIKQLSDRGISSMMSCIENSYARYFNTKHKRLGPLWAGRFKSVHIKDSDQLYHLTRYIHLNPVSANLVDKPENWKYSSYKEYISKHNDFGICDFNNLLAIRSSNYKQFVEYRIAYQKQISKIKKLLLD